MHFTRLFIIAFIPNIWGLPVQAASQLVVTGTIYKTAAGTSFDAWKFKILGAGSFTVDVAAYEASQSSASAIGFYTQDINGDGELTWLDADTYFYHDTGTIKATDAIFRCDDLQNNCGDGNYYNGYTPTTSPLTRVTRLQSEAPVDGSVHFRRDPWYDVTVNTPGDYLFVIGDDYRLDPAEAQAGINANDSFSPPTGFVNPITEHADYALTFSSSDLIFSLSDDTVMVQPVPLPGSIWLLGGFMWIWGRLWQHAYTDKGFKE